MTLRALAAVSANEAQLSKGVGCRSRFDDMGTVLADASRVEVRLVTLQAKERLVLPEHVVGHRTVRVMANHAVFFDRCVLENERALMLRMTLIAEVINSLFGADETLHGSVHLVATAATHESLSHRMV